MSTTIVHHVTTGTGKKPCGCPLDQQPIADSPCGCAPDGLTPDGTFRRECPFCAIAWEGHRIAVVDMWWEHVRAPEHMSNYVKKHEVIKAATELEQRANAGDMLALLGGVW